MKSGVPQPKDHMMKQFFLLLNLAVAMVWMPDARAALSREKAVLTFAPDVPPPITRREPAIVEVNLNASRKVMPLASHADYDFWTFNDRVPGPFVRARVGDWLEVRISNTDTSGMPHNVDFHAVTGPGGGADALTVVPGTTNTAWFRLQHAGLYVYHCAVPPMIDHIANGMFGLIMVDPVNALPKADKEFYVVQSEFYTTNNPDGGRLLGFSHERAMEERPSFVVFNGESGAMFFTDALQANVGERIRIYFGNAGPNLISSFHVIGTLMQNVRREGSLANPPENNLQTVAVSPGSVAIVEITPGVPGIYTFLDHNMAHSEKGALGQIKASGAPQPEIWRTAQDGPPGN